MKNLKTYLFVNSWMSKTVEKVFSRGKVLWVKAWFGREVAMKMMGK